MGFAPKRNLHAINLITWFRTRLIRLCNHIVAEGLKFMDSKQLESAAKIKYKNLIILIDVLSKFALIL